MSTIPNTYAEAQARNISYKAWRYMCEQEEIEREQAEDPTESPDYVTHEYRFDPRDEEEAIFDRACERAPLPYSESLSCSDDDEDDEDEDKDEEFFAALADPNARQIVPGEDPDSICMCPACSALRAKFEHDVALARAVLHCPEPIPCNKNHFGIETGNQCPRCGKVVRRDELGREIDLPEENQLAEAALNSPLARWIQGQLAMERWAS